ncbi:DinB family protein [Thalassobacillus hwangdonensis]|uniref:DinB family protein n=1 Tax=Thalassobacillus hwangdonensis TaxID=546108 RepID=A0ABW3L5Y5_9BACI
MKQETINNYRQLENWLSELKQIPEKEFYAPMEEGKWSLAALVSHFKYWDDFVLQYRLKPIVENRPIEDVRVTEKEMNEKAEAHAHSGIDQDALVDEVIAKRHEVVGLLEEITEDKFGEPVSLGDRSITVKEYIDGLTEHDDHHRKQVESITSVS